MQVNISSLYFTFGSVSKLIATVVTYPLQVFQTRVRVWCSFISCLLFWFHALDIRWVAALSALALLVRWQEGRLAVWVCW